MMLHRRSSSVLALTLFLALSAVPKFQAAAFRASPLLVQAPAPPAFKLPESVTQDTIVKIDGSTSLESVNQALKQRFEQQYAGTKVESAYSGTKAALQSVLDGKIDIAAIGRPLTDAEKAQGLTAVPIARHKIAIFVSPNSPFQGDITFDQFAKIFRGEITDWSQLGAGSGGASGAIKFIDRPSSSDTRSAFENYPVFQKAPFQTGANATQVAEDTTDAMVKALGTDGIGYAIADQVMNRPDVRIVQMHKTLPTNPAYPFSQALTYVYKDPASPAVQAFLGFATDPGTQSAIAAGALGALGAAGSAGEAALAESPTTSPAESPTAAAESPGAALSESASPAASSEIGTAAEASPTTSPAAVPEPQKDWWLLLPLVLGIGGLVWWLKGRQRTPSLIALAAPPAVPPATLESPPTALAARAGSVISADRSTSDPAIAPPIAEPAPGISPGILAAGGAAIAGAGILAGGLAQRNSRIILTPRNFEQAYAYWETPEAHKAELRQQGGQDLKLRLDDVTDLADDTASSHSVLQFDVLETDTDRHMPIPISDRDYVADIGYVTADDQWLSLARSAPVRVASEPPVIEQPAPGLNLGDAALAGGLAAGGLAAFGALHDSDSAQTALPEPIAPEPVIPASRIVLTSRSATEAYAYWEAPAATRAALQEQGGKVLMLRVCDVTDLDPGLLPHRIQSYACAEADTDRHVPIPASGRDYTAEIGYLTADGEWLLMAKSAPVSILPTSAELTEAIDPALIESEPVASEPALMEVPSEIEPAEPTVRGAEAIAPEPELLEPEPPDAALGAAALAAGAGLAARAWVTRDEPGALELEASEPELPEPELPEPGLPEPGLPEPEVANLAVEQPDLSMAALASVDDGLPDLPLGYGESRITVMPRDPHWAYAYWDVPDQRKAELRQQGGTRLALRFYDVSDIDLTTQNPHSLQQYYCEEFARDWYLPVPLSDRDYIVEIGYVTEDGGWLMLARSIPVRIPPVYPSDWHEEKFLTIDWHEEIQSQTLHQLGSPDRRMSPDRLYEQIFGLSASAEAERVAGSLFGSMQQVPQAAASSFVFPSGAGMMSGIGMSGIGMSGVGMSGVGISGISMMSGVGMSGIGMYSLSGIGISGIGMMSGVGMMSGMSSMYSLSGIGMSGVGMYSLSGIGMMSGVGMMSGTGMMSGVGMYSLSGAGMMSGIGISGFGMSGFGMSGFGMYSLSGIGMAGLSGIGMSGMSMSGIGMSGIGFSASAPPMRPRQFWLVADAELIVHGATEPDATVMIAGQPIKLSPDGTFRFQMLFPDGQIDFPILAIAADGEQNRAIHLRFNRETPVRRTNTREEAVDEWLTDG
jgi:ABC-type phosphate transport system substrate-binding protein